MSSKTDREVPRGFAVSSSPDVTDPGDFLGHQVFVKLDRSSVDLLKPGSSSWGSP